MPSSSLRELKENVDKLSVANLVTEKRKYVTSVLEELNRDAVCQRLSTAFRDSEEFSWQSVFDVAMQLAEKELKDIRKHYMKAQDESASQRTPKMPKSSRKFPPSPEFFNFFKAVVTKFSDAALHGFPAKDVADFCFLALQDAEAGVSSAYWREAGQIVVKCILCDSSRHVVVEPDKLKWFIASVIEYLLSDESSVDPTQYSDALRAALTAAVTHCELEAAIFDRVAAAFNHFKSRQPAKKVWENLIVCANVLCETYGFDRRLKACSFGENVGTRIVGFFEVFVDQSFQTEVTKFFCLQFALHHPGNVTGSERGSISTLAWKAIVKELYQKILDDLSKVLMKYPNPRKMPAALLSSDTLELICRTITQRFAGNDGTVSVDPETMDVVPDSTTVEEANMEPPRKKQRCEAGWRSTLSGCFSQREPELMLPWLEVIAHMLSKFSTSISDDDALLIMKELVYAADAIKRLEVLCRILEVLRTAVVDLALHRHSKRTDYAQLLLNLQSLVQRMMSSHSVQGHAMALVSALIDRGLCTIDGIDSQLMRVLGTFVSDVAPETLTWIFSILTRCDFDERLTMEVGVNASRNQYAFRTAIMDWIFTSPRFAMDEYAEVSGSMDNNEASIRALKLCPPAQVAEILTLLICDKPGQAVFCTKMANQKSDLNGYLKVEDFLVKALYLDNAGEESGDDGQRTDIVKCILPLAGKFVEKLVNEVSPLLNSLKGKSRLSLPEFKNLVNHWCLLWCCSTLFGSTFPSAMAAFERLFVLSKDFWESVTSRMHGSRESKLVFLQCTKEALDFFLRQKTNLTATLIPAKLTDFIFSILADEFNVYGSPKTTRPQGDDNGLLREAIAAFGSILQFCCSAKDILSTEIPQICLDFMRAFRESPLDFATSVLALREISRFFCSKLENDKADDETAKEVCGLFVDSIRSLLVENRHDNSRACQLLDLLKPLASWAAGLESVGNGYLDVLVTLMSSGDVGTEVVAAVLRCYDYYLNAAKTPQCHEELAACMKLRRKSFRVNYAMGQVVIRLIKDVDGFEQMAKPYISLLKQAENKDYRGDLANSFCVAMCNALTIGVSFHAPCLLKLMDAAKENCLDLNLCKAVLQHNFGTDGVTSLFSTNLDVVLSYWIRSYGIDFERFPYQFWNASSLDQFLQSVCTRLIPIASVMAEYDDLDRVFNKFTTNLDGGDQIIWHSLAAAACTSLSKESTVLRFLKALIGGDIGIAAKKHLVNTIVILCQWMVPYRKPMPNTIEQTEKSFRRGVEWLLKSMESPNLTVALGQLPERSIQWLLFTLQKCACNSFSKSRWIDILHVFTSLLNFHQLGNDMASFVIRIVLGIICATLRSLKEPAEIITAFAKLKEICSSLYRQSGQVLAEHLDAPLATVISIWRRSKGLEKQALETGQAIVEMMRKSKSALGASPLVPAAWDAVRAEQFECRKTWDLKKVYQTLSRQPIWMFSTDDLEFVARFIEQQYSTSAPQNDEESQTSFARKLLLLTTDSTDAEVRNAAVKLLAKLCKYYQSCVSDALQYSWNYTEPLALSFLITLDECLRSGSPEVSSLTAEGVVKAIDSIPAVRSALAESACAFPVLKSFLTKKTGGQCLPSLLGCGDVKNSSDNANFFTSFVMELCKYGRGNGDEFLMTMEHLFVKVPWVGERLLPYVIEHMVRKEPAFAKFAADEINGFLRQIADKKQDTDSHDHQRRTVRSILGIVRRLQHSEIKKPGLESYAILPLDYTLMAQAASNIGLPSMAPLFTEIGTEALRTTEMEMKFDLHFTSESLFSELASGNPRIGTTLLNTFLSLEDAEAVDGLGEFGAANPKARIMTREMDGDISKMITLYSSLGSAKELVPWYLTSSSVACGGRNHAVGGGIGSPSDNEYSCAWKLCRWDAFDNSKLNTSCTFNRLLFERLKCFDADSAVDGCPRLWSHLLGSMGDAALPPQLVLRRMALVDDLETAFSAVKNEKVEEVLDLKQELSNIDDRLWLRHAMANRILTCAASLQRLQAPWIAKHFTALCCEQLALCRRKNLHLIGLQVVESSKKVVRSLFENQQAIAGPFIARIELEEVELLWAAGETLRASSLLKSLAEKLNKQRRNNDPETLCSLTKCLVLLREFKLRSGTVGNSNLTSNEKFMETTRLLQNASRNTTSNELSAVLGAAHLAMAQFANQQYQELTDYIKSPLFVAKKTHVDKLRQDAQHVDTTLRNRSPLAGTSVGEKTYLVASQRKCDVDVNEISEIMVRQRTHLVTALTSYMSVLELCNDHDVLIFRVVSLWFENFKMNEATSAIERQLQSVKTYKWLAVFPQLASHLTASTPGVTNSYAKVILEIVRSVVADHPFHTFYTLYALATTEPRDDVDKNRQTAAKSILDQGLKGRYRNALINMKQLVGALNDLHDLKLKRGASGDEIPAKRAILGSFGDIPLPTMTIEPNPSGDYEMVPKISSFDKEVTMMSGLSAPKRVTCLCSDGIRRRLILKGGQDDLRQDALMEQVFRLVNIRLKRKARECGAYEGQYGNIRTYNVVPLSPTVGLIENCEGCISLGDYLVGSGMKQGAKMLYYPKGLLPSGCRQQISDVSKDTLDKRLKVFLEVCKRSRPVFRHFFYERFPDANEWYERRRAYTISVAVSSMLGHIIGLSDRHVQNIMIDEKTGEVVHIDHGMAFEQGALLPTPEKVPFRLTREMTNPMGICGLNGLFRRSCIRTMTVLKESKDILLPILSVLLHDPISQWTLTQDKAMKKQKAQQIPPEVVKAAFAEGKNVHAERAIIRVSDKLNGREKTELLSVDGQVSLLIDQARDPNNLCMMFAGWQAYL